MGEVDIKKNYILYLKQGVKSIKGKSKENLLLFTYYGGKFEMAKGPKIWFLTLVQPPGNEIQLREKHEYAVTLLYSYKIFYFYNNVTVYSCFSLSGISFPGGWMNVRNQFCRPLLPFQISLHNM